MPDYFDHVTCYSNVMGGRFLSCVADSSWNELHLNRSYPIS